ncbi:MAG: twin-arginine translocase TatA/TatE family subunit [Candidatus Altiarchaeota archaeon]
MLGNTEIMAVLAAAFLLFGPEKLPELARQFGELANRMRAGPKDVI